MSNLAHKLKTPLLTILEKENDIAEIALSDVVYREDLYPRFEPDFKTIQHYAEDITVLPPIEINQHGILIDGYHRWTAHRKVEAETIKVIITETDSEADLFALACDRNSAHGLQMSLKDKKSAAIKMYASGTGREKPEIARILSVSERTVNNYLSRTDKELREQRKQQIFDMWLACYSQDEIASAVDVSQKTVDNSLVNFENMPKLLKNLALFQDTDFTPPIYNVWTFEKEKSNKSNHFGNSEQRIVDNLLYLYTEPFDIVLDPFAGGGSTIDVCKERLRRYYVSDRKPIIERESEIRLLDIATDLPDLNNRWSDVTLTYLDPPYWKQAENQYSEDAEDLANMPLEQFTETLIGIVNRIAEKQSKGHIALLIQPTQWKSENRSFTDHVMHIVSGVDSDRLQLVNRVSCPYQTQQYNAQQVNWAKDNKALLVLSRELIIWSIR